MMEPVFFLVAILGCGDDGAACREARTLPARYASAGECRAALPKRLAENTDITAPTIMADCRAAGPRAAAAGARAKSKG